MDRAIRDCARRLRREMTPAERTLWSCLRAHRFSGFSFRRQHPIPPYVVDFCCPDTLLVIEVDGGYHDLIFEKDTRRAENLNTMGYRVLRFTNEEILKNLEGVLESIRSAMGYPLPPLPLERGGNLRGAKEAKK